MRQLGVETVVGIAREGAAEDGRLPSTPLPFSLAGLSHRQAGSDYTRRRSIKCLVGQGRRKAPHRFPLTN